MGSQNFGEILRKTRERKGLDLNTTARRLRIRPDILKAIESSNFAAMPPRGYARNMVNGYARFLGLNATDITSMYLDDLAAYQAHIESTRPVRDTGFDMSEAPSNTLIPHRGAGSQSRQPSRQSYGRASDYEGSGSMYGENIVPSENRRGSNRSAQTEKRAGTRRHQNAPVPLPRGDNRQASGGQNRTRQARGNVMPDSHDQFTNLYSGPKTTGLQNSRIRFIIAALVILVVVVVVCVLLFGMRSNQSTQTVPNVPVTGLSDEAEDQTKVVETAPTKFTFAYTVESGTSSWIEVYVDGSAQVAEVVTGPATKSFDCTGTLEFISATSTGVTATQDGSPVTLTPNSNGVIDLTIKYSDVLAAWNKAHPNAATSTSTSTSTSTTSASTSSTATSSTSSTSTTGAATTTGTSTTR